MLSFVDHHPISLRTAVFVDDGVLGYLVLGPKDWDWKPGDLLEEFSTCWVYRRHPSMVEVDAITGTQHYEEHELEGLSTLRIRPDPDFEFLWSANGQSVCAVVNGEPMGFICEQDDHAYSKTASRADSGFAQNAWNEDLFEETFKA